MALRLIPDTLPDLKALRAPECVASWGRHAHGLVLMTGPTGSGKSTLLAALLHDINQHCEGHLLTLEDPIEYEHAPLQCLIHQREVGRDTPDFESGLRAALREDPDVILVGEMRDAATMRLALTAAETGHLVLSTLHTANAPQQRTQRLRQNGNQVFCQQSAYRIFFVRRKRVHQTVNGLCKRQQFLRGNARFVVSPIDIHLQANLQGRQVSGSLR